MNRWTKKQAFTMNLPVVPNLLIVLPFQRGTSVGVSSVTFGLFSKPTKRARVVGHLLDDS